MFVDNQGWLTLSKVGLKKIALTSGWLTLSKQLTLLLDRDTDYSPKNALSGDIKCKTKKKHYFGSLRCISKTSPHHTPPHFSPILNFPYKFWFEIRCLVTNLNLVGYKVW